MLNELMSRITVKLLRKIIRYVLDSWLADELKAVTVNYRLRPTNRDICSTEVDVRGAYLNGYSDSQLNEYIIAKSRRWIESLNVADYVVPPHMYSLLWVIQVAQVRLGRSLRVIDFGGGPPTIPVLLRQLGMGQHLDSYKIIENPAFISRVPPDWKGICNYADTFDGDSCDLLILSSVLPYLSRDLVRAIYCNINLTPPHFIYFGRTSFLRNDYPEDEVYTVQDSPFRDHGVQGEIGMAHIADNIAHHAKRHFKWSEISNVLNPLGYRQVLELTDQSGLENIESLGLHSRNSLWELQG
ncbi:MAG: hypothetical protein JW384_00739 [Nitrosomonadaceae bacterium]|nr:hypothetical protein [Nitrosomonadaceae bacterium]